MSDESKVEPIEETDEGSLVVLPKNELALGSRGPQIWCSVEGKDDATLVKVLRWKNTESQQLGTFINSVVQVENVLLHPVELVNKETGEVSGAIRMVLIDSDGNTVSCCSEYARKSLEEIAVYKGMPPYVPPLKLKVCQVNTRGGRRIYQFELQPADCGKNPQKRNR